MRLLRLELFGFKSFLNRTVFTFNEGITSIVGPNGCGKSNVVDAIVWVLGERGTKSLRVKDMGDVIFHGSNGKKPVNIAEVTLEMQDGDKEYAVRRRIYRDGVNEYFFNGKVVRLKDIQDFFLGTGIGLNSYAIVEQGKIEHFILMKPQERRILIEEASGITRFEEKKREAATRLEEVKTNLDRVDDIYKEVKKNFASTEIEWERWKSYKTLTEELGRVEVQILADGFRRVEKRIEKIVERQAELNTEFTRKEEERESVRNELDAKEEEFTLTESVMHQLEVDIKGLEKDMEGKLRETEYLEGEKKRLTNEQEELSVEIGRALGRIGAYREEITTLSTEREHDLDALNQGEAGIASMKTALEEMKTKREACEKKVDEERVALFGIMSAISDMKNRIAEMERKREEKRRRDEKRAEEIARLEEKLSILEKAHDEKESILALARDERVRLLSEESSFQKEKEELSRAIEEVRRTIARSKGEKQGKEEYLRQISGTEGKKKKDPPPHLKKLVDLINFEGDHEKAFERFFLKEMDYYVMMPEDKARSLELFSRYDENYIFFPPKGIFTRRGAEVEITVTTVTSIEEALRRIDDGEEGVFISGNICIDSRGLILAEREARTTDYKRLTERVRLEKAVKTLSEEIDRQGKILTEGEKKLQEISGNYAATKIKRDAQEKTVSNLEKDIVASTIELKSARERLKELENVADFFDEVDPEMFEKLRADMESHGVSKDAREKGLREAKSELDEIKGDYDVGLSRWNEMSVLVERKRNELLSLKTRIDGKVQAIESLEADIGVRRIKAEQVASEIHARAVTMKTLEDEYEAIRETHERNQKRFEELKVSVGAIHMQKSALETRMEEIYRDKEKIQNRREGVEKELVVLTEKKSVIAGRLRETYAIEDISGIETPPQDRLDEERERLEKEIADLGEVNFRADREYHELKERIAFLEQQKIDLEGAMDSLKKTITKIDTMSKDIFTETFSVISENFKRFSAALFKGGKGHMTLNPDTGGVEIYVQPPGKRVIRMELLSGGEKALISLSFLLSLMDTRPSPFTLLDEIDAPLDDANLVSLLDIIRDMSRKTQMVFITHNRITMGSSDTIYGITMEEEGVSKTISVRL